MTEEPTETPPGADEPLATVTQHRDWYLVAYGTWEISVGPDGLLMLPRHLVPSEAADFCACARAAAEVGQQVIDANKDKTKTVDLASLPSATPAVTDGDVPAGRSRLGVTPRGGSQQTSATIGRPKARGRDPRTAGVNTPMPRTGVRNGQR